MSTKIQDVYVSFDGRGLSMGCLVNLMRASMPCIMRFPLGKMCGCEGRVRTNCKSDDCLQK